jgi:hypothetical protein
MNLGRPSAANFPTKIIIVDRMNSHKIHAHLPFKNWKVGRCEVSLLKLPLCETFAKFLFRVWGEGRGREGVPGSQHFLQVLSK